MKQFTTLDFEIKNKLIVLKCNINDVNRTFILDSGAPKVILNSKYQERMNYEKYEGRELKGATGVISQIVQKKIDRLCCGNVEKRDIESLVMELSQLEEAIQDEVYGLIGYDFFSEYNVYLDYPNLKLGFWNDVQCEEFLSKNTYQFYNFRMEKHLPIIECKIGRTLCQMALETGANTNLVDIKLQSSLNKSINFVEEESNIIGANDDSTMSTYKTGSMKNLEVEGLGNFTEMNTVFADVSNLNQNSSIKIQGILGYELLYKQRVIIGFTRHKLYVLR
ncbi:aspartyl protease family protein [Viridibacillus sp. YIM B01967]|uniref:Aspartyl protease family protein n=1 Tax=Viridibacillus soli TaxID=2798301 RepID=A0ABS1H342_9BACL|nr:aspartyl protease family protein [Viridibacillus soli]MBK3493831.1 aspartyl protease family protein [Viridibacillus soli]